LPGRGLLLDQRRLAFGITPALWRRASGEVWH